MRAQQVPPPPGGSPLLGSWLPSFQHPSHTCNPAAQTQPNEFNAIHTSVIPVDPRRQDNPLGGKVLVWDVSSYLSCNEVGGNFHQRWAIVDPATQAVQTHTWVIPAAEAPPAMHAINGTNGNQGLFCAGHCWLRDGRLLVAGGDDWTATGGTFAGSKLVCVFDPWAPPSSAWSIVRDANLQLIQLKVRRWYPTLVRMADAQDTVGIFGGVETWNFANSTVNQAEYAHRTYEALHTRVQQVPQFQVDTRTGITIGGQQQNGLFAGPQLATSADSLYYYPRMHLLSRQALQNTSLLGLSWMAGMVTESAWVEHINSPMLWPQPRPIVPNGSNILFEPASVVFPNVSPLHEDLIVTMGGEVGPLQSPTLTNKVWVLPARNAAPAWTNPSGFDMRYARKFHKAVLLPDTSVLVVGGGQNGGHGTPGREVFWPEVFLQGQWQYCQPEIGAQGPSPRTYHSCGVLLPSGEVLSCGGNTRNVDYQVFRPHYFDGSPQPPTWRTATPTPTSITYGQQFLVSFTLPFGLALDKVVLTTPMSTTHAQDPGQRCIQLPFEVADSGDVATVTAPACASHAIPGCYMIWLVSSAGVPSVARWVFLA